MPKVNPFKTKINPHLVHEDTVHALQTRQRVFLFINQAKLQGKLRPLTPGVPPPPTLCSHDTYKLDNSVEKNTDFDIVYTVRRNQLHKQTNKMHFLYVFILQLLYTLHVSNDCFVHHQETTIYCICSSVQTVQTCLTVVPTVRPSSQTLLHGLYRAADTVNCGLLMTNETVVRNM